MLEHARALGFDARRCEVRKPVPKAADQPAAARAPAPVPAVAKKKAAPAKKAPAKKAAPPAKPVPAKAAQKTTAQQVAQAVLASLQKMPTNKPTRHAGLLKHIETHASKAADPKSMALQVSALLMARKEVVVAPDGKGVSYPKIKAKEPPALDG